MLREWRTAVRVDCGRRFVLTVGLAHCTVGTHRGRRILERADWAHLAAENICSFM
jgi:hypothetical protein